MERNERWNRWAAAGLRGGAVCLVLLGGAACSSQKPASGSGEGSMPGDPARAAAPSATPAKAVTAGAPAPVPGKWTLVEIKDLKVEQKDGKSQLAARVALPGVGWRVEIRPRASAQKDFLEFEVVGMPPDVPSGAAIEERPVSLQLDSAPTQPIIVHGLGGVIFPD